MRVQPLLPTRPLEARTISSFGSRSPACSAASSPAPPLPMTSRSARSSSTLASSLDPEAGVDVSQASLGLGLDVAVDVAAEAVHADGERAQSIDAQLPEALRHQLLEVDLFDRVDLERLDRGRAADDR